MNNIISVFNLSKSYGDVKAVDKISFDVEAGSLFSFIGMNGAGKSTTINILCSILTKDSGKVIINNHNIDTESMAIKNEIGIVFQNSVLDGNLTVLENLKSRGSLYGLYGNSLKSRISHLTDLLGLENILSRKYGTMSGGQKRKVDIARALINDPKILFMDEPTTGLDPQTRALVWSTIDDLRKTRDLTVFLTTHYMEETALSDKVVIIDNGKIVAQNSPHLLKVQYAADYVRWYTEESTANNELLQSNGLVGEYVTDRYEIKFRGGENAKQILATLGDKANDFEILKGDMDDVFLNVTGKKLN